MPRFHLTGHKRDEYRSLGWMIIDTDGDAKAALQTAMAIAPGYLFDAATVLHQHLQRPLPETFKNRVLRFDELIKVRPELDPRRRVLLSA